MRIEVSSSERSFKLVIPTSFILNPLGFSITKRFIKIEGVDLSAIKGGDVTEIAKIIKKYKKENPDWYLVDIESNDGDKVKIKF